MNLDGSTYTLKDTENLTGTTASSVTPAVKSYTGFTSPSTQTVTIAGDGSTVVEYKYSRNKYYLDVNHTLNNEWKWNNSKDASVGTFDVYINGTLVSNDVGDYYTEHYYGTTYEIKGISAMSGYTYTGSSSYSGTLTATKAVVLAWEQNSYELYPANRSQLTAYTAGSNQTVTIGTSTLTVQANGQGSGSSLYRAAARTTNLIDFSQYSTIRVVGKGFSRQYGTWGGVIIGATSKTYIDGYAADSSGAVITESWAWSKNPMCCTSAWTDFDVTYDISSLNGSYYLYALAYSYYTHSAGLQITQIILGN